MEPVIIIGLIALLFLATKLSEKRVDSDYVNSVRKELDKFRGQLGEESEGAKRDLIVQMDRLMCKTLKKRYGGDTCKDGLISAEGITSKDLYDKVWDFHRLRNRIVHEGEDVSSSELKESYDVARKFINSIIAT